MTAPSDMLHLGPEQIDRLSSQYFVRGRQCERWRIDAVEMVKDSVTATARMIEHYVSETDEQGFHLSFVTALEMVSQLTIIYLHLKAGLNEKCREVWVSESRNKLVRPIRSPDNIRLEMTVEKLRQRGDSWFSIASYRVTDAEGGLFEYWGKAWMQ